LTILISFDIDGTLEVGDPPGPITMSMVRRAQEYGCIIGSCSDRPLTTQRAIWDTHNIPVSFVAAKHLLAEVKAAFPADSYYHVGDTNMDQQAAREAGFNFLTENAGALEPWIQSINGLGH
jgi:hypothetical protein